MKRLELALWRSASGGSATGIKDYRLLSGVLPQADLPRGLKPAARIKDINLNSLQFMYSFIFL